MEKSWKQRWLEKLQNTYRFVIMNDETFEEVGSYKLTLLNVYVVLSTVVVLVALVVVLLIAFTPVKRYLPGYSVASDDVEVLRLAKQVDQLEKELKAQQTYSESFRRMLVGDVQTEEDLPAVDPDFTDTFDVIERSEVTEQLSQEIELQDVSEVARRGRGTNLASTDIPLEQLYFSSPVSGEISAGFMPDKNHFGVDVLAPKNTAIKAIMDGYVFLSDWTLETGNTIGIQHAHNIITFYKHNSVLLKKVGSYVKAGEAVAIIGNTGTLSSGPHLHFELWYKGKSLDPTEYIDF